MEILLVVLYAVGALVGFGAVIAIHEFGHFIIAKWADVKVFRFAIGFGPVLLRHKWGETEYALCALPFGGYVWMLGQEDGPEEDAKPTAAESLDPRSFLAKSGWWRMWIMLGGVLANLISSALLLLALAFWGMPLVPPVIGDVVPKVVGVDGAAVTSPAAILGLRQGDRIHVMNGERVRSFDDLHIGTLFHSGDPVQLEIERAGQRLILPAAGAATVALVYDRQKGGGTLGISPADGSRIFTVDGELPAGGPAYGERILAVAGQPVIGLTGQQITARLMPFLGQDVTLTVARDGSPPRETTIRYAGADSHDSDSAVAGFPVRVRLVLPDSRCAGILFPGDLITAVDGSPVAGSYALTCRLRASLDAERDIVLKLRRGDEERTETVRGSWISGARILGLVLEEITSGHIPFLPEGLGGGPSGLTKTGVKSGDVLLAMEPQTGGFAISWGQGTVHRVPIDQALATALAARDRPHLLSRIGRALTGQVPLPPAALDRIRLGEVRVVAAPVAGVLPLTDDAGSPIDVSLDSAVAKVIPLLNPGDRVVALVPTGDGFALEVVRDLTGIQHRVVPVAAVGTSLSFRTETVPYQLSGPGEAFVMVADAAEVMIVKTLLMIPRFFRPADQGGVDATRTLSGPVGIFRSLWIQLQFLGVESYLRLLAFIGLNLVLVNLLPIPITDGGQLMFLAVEKATGRPVVGWLRNLAMIAGLVLVIGLMAFTVGLDILRWTGLL